MTKHKLSLPNVKDTEANRNFAAINSWANIVEDILEVRDLNSEQILYLGVDTSSGVPELVLFKRVAGEGDTANEQEIGRIAFL